MFESPIQQIFIFEIDLNVKLNDLYGNYQINWIKYRKHLKLLDLLDGHKDQKKIYEIIGTFKGNQEEDANYAGLDIKGYCRIITEQYVYEGECDEYT